MLLCGREGHAMIVLWSKWSMVYVIGTHENSELAYN